MSIDDFNATPVFAISVVAQLTGMHPQTLRQYDRMGLVTPQRSAGGGRRYTALDIDRLREIQQLSADGIGLAGIKRILELELEVERLARRLHELQADLDVARGGVPQRSAPPVSSGAELVLRDRASVVVWRRPSHTTLG